MNLVGVETEYGFTVEGHGAAEQIDDAIAFVKAYSGPCFLGWDYRFESPRSDLRGFKLEGLAIDPVDAQFDIGREYGSPHDIRSDRILPNGARFYNDHGHPEYATPECLSLKELAIHDRAGETVLRRAGRALSEATGLAVKVYKNNTDFHGASYGAHESYLAPRRLGYKALYDAVAPVLVARQILSGAGKVGAETGKKAVYQLSSRADFFVEAANAETLFRRPIFNTRDEPHADPAEWIRLHVISGDANMNAGCTVRKVGVVRLAVRLAEIGEAPHWAIKNPVESFQLVSRDVDSRKFEIACDGRTWTDAYTILEELYSAAEARLELDAEEVDLIKEGRALAESIRTDGVLAEKCIDWAIKKKVLGQVVDALDLDWADDELKAYDLEYHNIDPDESLYYAMEQMGEVERGPTVRECAERLTLPREGTRALARALAVQNFGEQLATANWRALSLRTAHATESVELQPDKHYPASLADISDVESFVDALRNISCQTETE